MIESGNDLRPRTADEEAFVSFTMRLAACIKEFCEKEKRPAVSVTWFAHCPQEGVVRGGTGVLWPSELFVRALKDSVRHVSALCKVVSDAIPEEEKQKALYRRYTSGEVAWDTPIGALLS